MDIFDPKSVAVVGASSDMTKIGSVIVHNLFDAGYAWEIYPVNPKYPELFGRKAYAKVSDIPSPVDMVIVSVPAAAVGEVLEDVGKKGGVKSVIVISAGFSEIGEPGAQLEAQLGSIAKKHGFRLLGPNCLGLIVPGTHLNASFAAATPADGNIAFLSQSGAFNTAMLDMALEQGLGFSHFVSMGNKVDLDELDFLSEWLADDKVKVIGIYIEEFEDGRALVEMVAKFKKPVVILHPGESEEARKAISSHTGSLANSALIVETALRQANIVQVHSIEEMFNTLKMFSWLRQSPGKRVVVVTNAGGPGIIATDLLVEAGLQLAEIDEGVRARLKEFLPPASGVQNPVDLLGDANAARYSQAIEVLSHAGDIDTILVLLTPQFVTEIEQTGRVVVEKFQSGKAIIPTFLGGQEVNVGLHTLWGAQVPGYDFLEEAVRSLASVVSFSLRTPQIDVVQYGQATSLGVRVDLDDLLSTDPVAVPHELVQKLAQATGINIPPERIVHTNDEAIAAANDIGYPVVIKATTEVVAHKTDVKAIHLNIQNEVELLQRLFELRETLKDVIHTSEPPILLQKQVKADLELLVGVQRDGNKDVYAPESPGFGHVLLFGTGGIYTEVYEDIASGLVPMSDDGIRDLIARTKAGEIVHGVRGKEPLALDKLVDIIKSVQRLVMEYPEIDSLDINPLLLSQGDAVVADLKIFVKK